MINAIIVENEDKHIEHLSKLLERNFPEISVLKICKSVPDGIKAVNELKPELLFLDVELPPYTSFDLLEKTEDLNHKVIFTTSHNKYAVRAFDFCALHYLIKPFGIDELKDAIDRFKQNTQSEIQDSQLKSLLRNIKQSQYNEMELYLPITNGKRKLRLGDIIYCTILEKAIYIYLQDDQVVSTTMNLHKLEELLSDYGFFRCHDSFLVNLHHITEIINVRDGAEITLTNKHKAEVSKRKKPKLLDIISSSDSLKGL